MKETILTCDRCKKKVSELIDVGAGKREYNYSSHGGGGIYKVYQFYAGWCIDCCIEMHVAAPNKENKAKPIQPPLPLKI